MELLCWLLTQPPLYYKFGFIRVVVFESDKLRSPARLACLAVLILSRTLLDCKMSSSSLFSSLYIPLSPPFYFPSLLSSFYLSLSPMLPLSLPLYFYPIFSPSSSFSLSLAHSTDLEHTLNVTASHENPVISGTTLTLTCIAVTSRLVHLQWRNSDNSSVNPTSSISIPPPLVVEQITTITLTFDPLKTSHAGLYTCSCVMRSPRSEVSASHKVVVQSKS